MSSCVQTTIKDNVAIVALNRPDKYNGLDMAMFDALSSTIKSLKKNRSIRVVILKGEGKAFCSGLDVMSVSKNPLNFKKLLKKENDRPDNILQEVCLDWRDIPVPVIAVTHGFCYGGGFQIALGADFRYTTPDCKFSILESKWGLIPDMSATVTLRELIPIDLAKELTMTARIFTGEEALEMNLVSKVSDDPMALALLFANELCEKSPDALVAAKKLYNNSWLADERTALDWETRLQKKVLGGWNQIAAVSRVFSKYPLPFGKRQRSL